MKKVKIFVKQDGEFYKIKKLVDATMYDVGEPLERSEMELLCTNGRLNVFCLQRRTRVQNE